MSQKNIIVVGGKFKKLLNSETVMTVEQVLSMVGSPELKQAHLQVEQGISETQVLTLSQKLKTYPEQAISIHSYYDHTQRCSKRYTHKVQDFNTLISEPMKIDEYHYQSILMIDEQCADLRDIVLRAGWQTMILVEAARQMTLAVTEKFFIDEADQENLSFVTISGQSKYYGDVLPIQTNIQYEIVKTRGLTNRNKTFTVSIKFYQNDSVVSEIEYQFSVFEKVHLKAKERVLAKSMINKIIMKNAEEVFYERIAA